MTKLQKALQAIVDQNTTESLKGDVAQSILDSGNDEEIKCYIKDVLNNGCVSGIASNLVYYTDTKEFFISHMEEIDELRQDMEYQIGEPLKIEYPLYNWLAWFAYEETTRKIADELNITY